MLSSARFRPQVKEPALTPHERVQLFIRTVSGNEPSGLGEPRGHSTAKQTQSVSVAVQSLNRPFMQVVPSQHGMLLVHACPK